MAKSLGLRPDQAVRRAQRCCGLPIQYKLGAGGGDPSLPLGSFSDCTGFVSWAWGVPRYQPSFPGQWFESTLICRDATITHRFFQQVSRAEPGDALVYGDWRDEKGKHREGHIALISRVDAQGRPVRIVHCSPSNATGGHGAVAETPVKPFWKQHKALIVRARFLVRPAPPEV